MRRTQQDENVCYRYKLYVDEGKKGAAVAGQQVVDCLQVMVPAAQRGRLQQVLPGYAGTVMENRPDGSVVLWAYSPSEETGMLLELAGDGRQVQRTPLAPNQTQWLRQQLQL